MALDGPLALVLADVAPVGPTLASLLPFSLVLTDVVLLGRAFVFAGLPICARSR
jgi:hypothetical protein